MVGKYRDGIDNKISTHNQDFLDIEDKESESKINQIINQGIHYGYIKVYINDVEIFDYYELQIIPAQWLRFIEIAEQFIHCHSSQTIDPFEIELIKLNEHEMKLKIKNKIYVLRYTDYIEQITHAAITYFQLYQSIGDNMYEELIEHLKKIRQKFIAE